LHLLIHTHTGGRGRQRQLKIKADDSNFGRASFVSVGACGGLTCLLGGATVDGGVVVERGMEQRAHLDICKQANYELLRGGRKIEKLEFNDLRLRS
jgi:hypothetical protein